MNRPALIGAAYLADQAFGDPEWFPHPVRCIGAAIVQGEKILRKPNQIPTVELVAGAALTTAVVAGTYCVTSALIREACRQSKLFGHLTELTFAWTSLAACNLEQETTEVTNSLSKGDMNSARTRLARIVGRDTQHLDESEISRAVIETAAESASDGIIAPLFYLAIGGAPLAMAYKAINTLDSMIGHADARYFYFGKTAARLDDVANYIPARLTALAIISVAAVFDGADPEASLRTWRRDGGKHKSPNAGQPESAMAGALHVQLGGANTYAGEVITAQKMGEDFSKPANEDARRAIRIISRVALLGVCAAVLLTSICRGSRRQ